MFSLEFTMIIKHFTFYNRHFCLKLELVQSMLFSILFITCLLLAFWQWKKVELSQTQDPLSEQPIKATINQLSLSGSWLSASFLLDNQNNKGRAGYHHLGLFKPDASKHALLVNLGWLQAPAMRANIPNPKLPQGKQRITIANSPIIEPIIWSTDHWPSPKSTNWPKRIQSIDIERFELATKVQIEPSYWQLLIGKGKLIDTYQIYPSLSKHKHLKYALQWLLLAIAAPLIGIISSIKEIKSGNGITS